MAALPCPPPAAGRIQKRAHRIGRWCQVAAWLVIVCGAALGEAANPAYEKKATWLETMLAARESMARQELAALGAGFHTFRSDVIRGGESARPISVPVAGQDEVYLYVTGEPDVIWGAATWAEARLIAADGRETRLGQKEIEVLEGRFDIDCNLKSGVSGPLVIAGRRFDRGVHVYAPSKIRVPLAGRYERFEASLGIDDWVKGHGAVRFHVTDTAGAARIDLWNQLAEEFSQAEPRRQMKWTRQDRILEADWTPGDWSELARRYAAAAHRVPSLAAQARSQANKAGDARGLARVCALYYRSRELDEQLARAGQLDFQALKLAIEDLHNTFGRRYADADHYLARLSAIEQALTKAIAGATTRELAGLERVDKLVTDFDRLQREALLANPLLDFDELLLIRRVPHGDPRRQEGTGYGLGEYIGLPRQSSKCNPGIEEPFAWDNEIAVLSPVRPQGGLKTLYRSEGRRLITDIDLHWDAGKVLFSMPGTHDKWQVFEIGSDGKQLRQVTPGEHPDVHNYDACYLPDGRIAFVSTAPLQGVPCNAGVIVGMMYMMNADGGGIRQVCFEQDHSYCPTVLNDGRLLYLRWDYTDTPHVWNRILFSMNPDGTGQAEFYGSNSYWPNSVFYARPVPNHPTKIAGIVTGHHVGRVGELVIFDPALGRHETSGVVQRIPGRGQKVEPLIEDKLTEHSWPKFLHPYPLSENYYLAACKPTPDDLWGIYLVDAFDNMVLIREEEGHALLEPIPLRKTTRPPVIPSRVDPGRDDASVFLADIYAGPGLAGVPRGTVKKLRLFTYHFGYQQIAGINHRVGADGPWEVKRVLGTVPVEADGSAMFRIPAKTPISIQPLDEDGKALQLMRSWMTALPGETLSCVGCHENRSSAPSPLNTIAGRKRPSEIEPWYGPERGFSFLREVQPVLDKYCVACHDGSPQPDGQALVDLRGDQDATVVYRDGDPEATIVRDTPMAELMKKYNAVFPPSYIALRRLVRVGGLESDLHLLPPKEFHADTSELVQMLRKGHHGVELDAEAWDRIVTWIDLNAPCHGTWSEFTRISGDQRQRRSLFQELYCGRTVDGEDVVELPRPAATPVAPRPVQKPPLAPVATGGWPFDAAEAARRQAAGGRTSMSLDLEEGKTLEFAWIPPGSFVMGDASGDADELPPTAVTIREPFWMSRCEITNEQYARFDPTHDSRFEHRTSWIFSEEYLGWPLNGPRQPVVRVSWERAMAFCDWLSRKTGLRVSLPTEGQWEYACRAGSDTPFWYGTGDRDFSNLANMADWTIRNLAYEGWRPKSPDLVPRDARSNDGTLVTADVASYAPNPWGLYDMHGNAAEWTRSTWRPYPYDETDGRDSTRITPAEAGTPTGEKVVRGGSWYDRPARCRSSFRLSYPAWQRVYNVGFRVVIEPPAGQMAHHNGPGQLE